MASTEIPRAEDCAVPTAKPRSALNDESQKKEGLEAISKIGATKPSVAVNFNALPEPRLISELEEKGFLVKYKVTYDSEKTPRHQSRVRIINPKLLTNGAQMDDFLDSLNENLRSFNICQGEGEEALEKLFSKFLIG